VIRRARHFLSLAADEQRAYLMIVWWLFVIRLTLNLTDFEQLKKFVSRQTVRRASAPSLSLTRLAAIIQNAGRRVPSTCLSRSLAGAIVLARFGYPSKIQIGVATDQDFQAHAWLESGGMVITEPEIAAARWTPLTRLTVGS
jgi:hypothetical protein